tara:strand:+ start:897 stop:1214 length:318 start_codon:yes stop_codon:yes gene_type:complete
MIIRRRAGRVLYWGEHLDPQDLGGTADGWVRTVEVVTARPVRASVAGRLHGGDLVGATLVSGESVSIGPVTLTLVGADDRGAHWDVRAPRQVRLLRDDAREARGR